jgi:hypothetical protein
MFCTKMKKFSPYVEKGLPCKKLYATLVRTRGTYQSSQAQ